MSTAYELEGRTKQKQRTRNALVDAARELVAQGVTPTVEEAAAAASISRTTAYRYFSSQRALLAAAHPETEMVSLLPSRPPADPATRLDLVVAKYTDMLIAAEAQQRTMLRLSLEASDEERSQLPLRQGRVIGWLHDALEPLRGTVDDDELHRLVLAIRSATGVEALVWLTDIGGLSTREAIDVMRWSASAMLRSALDGDGPAPRRATPKRIKRRA